ncbi:C-type lectin domain family 4 member E [Pectinophora gossypiella]|uniref:C-type lectin domain family 4 member E n=1 Tax=Pectinophora gossypiella TaxID=13191 RepID=UPI00214E7152|nr:C-type lectin domain family 4 member E [Pectinophora gossypiella]
MNLEIFVSVLFLGLVLALPPGSDKVYRPDYVYNKRTDAFYKLNIAPTSNRRARDLCKVEGAQLMVPSSKEDIAMVHGAMKKYPDIGDYVWIGDDGEPHDPAEDAPIIDLSEEERRPGDRDCDVVTRDGEIETESCYRSKPFVCKVEAKDAVYDTQCGVYGAGYKYYENVRSCYKVPNIPLTWDQSYAECRAEGAHLVVLNSEAEQRAIEEFLRTAPKVEGAHTSYFYYAGIRANRHADKSARVFRTIFNETLEEAGYRQWSDGEPNNHNDSEYCGTIFSNNGKYNDVDCSLNFGFICEKEVTPK